MYNHCTVYKKCILFLSFYIYNFQGRYNSFGIDIHGRFVVILDQQEYDWRGNNYALK